MIILYYYDLLRFVMNAEKKASINATSCVLIVRLLYGLHLILLNPDQIPL